jgi:hypothetical protein
MYNMKNLQTFKEFLNESLNEAKLTDLNPGQAEKIWDQLTKLEISDGSASSEMRKTWELLKKEKGAFISKISGGSDWSQLLVSFDIFPTSSPDRLKFYEDKAKTTHGVSMFINYDPKTETVNSAKFVESWKISRGEANRIMKNQLYFHE